MNPQARAAAEVGAVFALIALATVFLHRVALPLLADYRALLMSALFLGAAIRLSERTQGGLERYGLRLGGLLDPADHPAPGLWAGILDMARALLRAAPIAVREAAVALLICALVFPPFVAGFYVLHHSTHAFQLRGPEAPLSYLVTQLVVIALPEEALFRGFIQGRLEDAWPPDVRVFGARLSIAAWMIQAALFALLHLATEPAPARLAVFFPGLLFGWLRALRGGIGAAVVVHALCNLLADVLARSWF